MKTISSLAILKVNWDTLKKDYIENYVPFFIHLIKKINYTQIDANRIRKDFELEYGINLPYHPTLTILNRLKQNGFIRKSNTHFIPNTKLLLENGFEEISNQQQRKINNLLSKFVEFSTLYSGRKIDLSLAENILISYLNEHALEILFSSNQSGVLPEIKVSKSDKYIFNQFVLNLFQKDETLFSSLVDISIGHILANTILYNEFNNFLGELSGNRYYLDVPIILELLGANGKEKQQIYEEFISDLADAEIELFIFEHNYSELLHNLKSCLKWIGSSQYNPDRASRTLNYFVINNYTESDVDSLIVSVPLVLEKFKIKIVPVPDYKTNVPYQIDESLLKDRIIKLYKDSDPNFNEDEKDYMLQNDVDSISAIYRLRQGNNPTNIEEAKHIFIARNSTLAYVAFKYQTEFSENFTISSCITDTFIGTLIWLKSPSKSYKLNSKKMIADVYAALQPEKSTVRKYLCEINKLREKKNISPVDYYLLRSHRVSVNLLQDKIMGDPDNFTDQTPEELLEKLKTELKHEADVKFNVEKTSHQKTKEKLTSYETKLTKINISLTTIHTKIAKYFSWTLFNLVLIILIVLLFMSEIVPIVFKSQSLIAVVILLFFGVLNIGFGFNLLQARKKIESFLSKKIKSYLNRYF